MKAREQRDCNATYANGAYWVRAMEPGDVASALKLMRALARFEGYEDAFEVTESDLLEHGFSPKPLFHAMVAEDLRGGGLCGIAVVYTVPWTYTRKPALVLKELFVDRSARGRGIGRLLLRGVARHAKALGADQLRWTVLNDNSAAQNFYRDLGGVVDEPWVAWRMDAHSLQALL